MFPYVYKKPYWGGGGGVGKAICFLHNNDSIAMIARFVSQRKCTKNRFWVGRNAIDFQLLSGC